jgi:hypothetical protein
MNHSESMRIAILLLGLAAAACSSTSSSNQNGGDASADATGNNTSDGGRDSGNNTIPDGGIADVAVPPGPAATFSDVNAILGSKCSGCHQPSEGPLGDLDLSGGDVAYEQLVDKAAAGSECGNSGLKRVVPGNPGASLLYIKLRPNPPCGEQMPEDEPPLSQAELDKIVSWIADGAKKN